MLGLDEKEFWEIEKGAVALKPRIDKIVDDFCDQGYSNIVYIGIGGTYAHALVMKSIIENISTIPFLVVEAADFIHQNNPYLTKDSLVFMESVSGDTKELVKAAEIVKEKGCRLFGYVDSVDSPLDKILTPGINHKTGVFYKLYYTFLRFINKRGEFPEYDLLCKEMEKLPEVLMGCKEQFDPRAKEIAESYGDEDFIYLLGAGNTYGLVYSYAMCILEEMQWMRTKSIPGTEFFHGTLEIIERDTPVIMYKGEDYSRPIMERAENFIARVSRRAITIDSADFAVGKFDPSIRGFMSPFIFQTINERINKHLELYRRHPLDIRRYYRRLEY